MPACFRGTLTHTEKFQTMPRHAIAFVSLFLAATLATSAQADVVIGNLSNTRSPNEDTSKSMGQSFVNGTTAMTLDSVKIMQWHTPTFNANEVLTLHARNGDGTLGAQLASFGTGAWDFDSGITTFTPTASFNLAANTGYWLVLDSTTASVGWTYTSNAAFTTSNGATIPTTNRSFDGGSSYYDLSGGTFLFQVDAHAVPEPASALMLGAVALVLRRSARRR